MNLYGIDWNLMRGVAVKKLLIVASCVALLCCLGLAACSGGSSEEGEGESEIANPWTDAESAEEAATVAGVEFQAVEAPESWLGEPVSVSYRAMKGLVEVTYEYPAANIVVRKGVIDEENAGDVSGDYNEYAAEWDATLDDLGLSVKCFGPAPDKAAKVIWTNGDYDYAVMAIALGGEEDFGIPAADLAAYCSALK